MNRRWLDPLVWVLVAVAALLAGRWLGVMVRAVSLPSAAAEGASAAQLAGPAILYAFHESDCASTREFAHDLAAAATSGGVPVVGVLIGQASIAPETAARILGGNIAVTRDHRGAVERMLLAAGFDSTPVTIVYDSQGRARLFLPYENLTRDRVAQITRVAGLLNEL